MTKRMILPLAFGVIGIAILLWLGFWQLARLDWKETILSQIEERAAAAPVALPANPDPESDNRLNVRVSAVVGFDEAHVIASKKNEGPGFLVIAPALTKPDNRKILIDLGFIPEAQKDVVRAPQEITVTGALLWPNETDGFTPDPNLDRNIWFARDVDKMSAHFDTEPVFVVARQLETGDYGTEPQPIGHNIPNDHLEYAITWFSLAFVWFGMTAYLLWRIRQKTV